MTLLLILWLISGRTFAEYMETLSPILIMFAVFLSVCFIICAVAVIKYLFKKK